MPKARRKPAARTRVVRQRRPRAHARTHKVVHHHERALEPALLVERLPSRRRISKTLVAGLVMFAVLSAGTISLQSPYVVRALPDGFLSVADAAGLVPWLPWLPEASNLTQFEEQTLQPPVPDDALPLTVDDVVREVILQRTKLPKETALRVAETIATEAKTLSIDPLLVLAIIDVESKYDHTAISYRGARGLMQLMPETRAWFVDKTPELWEEAQREDTLDPVSNVRVGIHYFAHLSGGFRGVNHVLQAYNCGPARLVSILRGDSVLPEETKYYADRVLKSYSKLRRDYAFLRRA